MGLRDLHRFAARDGRSIPAYVTLPPGKASGPRPTVVLVHGGPAVRGAYWDWDSEAQFLASRGYVVIQPEFRGGTGFGADHFNAGLKQWGLAMQTDLVDAAQWAVKQGWADPKRIAIMGASYGSYATLMGLIQNPEVFRCGVEWAGVTDIDLLFSTTYSDASQENLKYGMRTLIGDPDNATDAARFRQYSPLLRAAELKQPLLMAHGLEDRRVPIVHATGFYDAVKRSNPNVELITYPNEGHGWSKEETRIAFWQRVEAFLDKNLKQAP
jgi:dipeptidyl aminopeptidase/acylaminoacyl peptidase